MLRFEDTKKKKKEKEKVNERMKRFVFDYVCFNSIWVRGGSHNRATIRPMNYSLLAYYYFSRPSIVNYMGCYLGLLKIQKPIFLVYIYFCYSNLSVAVCLYTDRRCLKLNFLNICGYMRYKRVKKWLTHLQFRFKLTLVTIHI